MSWGLGWECVSHCYFDNLRKTMAKHFQTQLVRRFGGYTIAIITVHAPDLHMWPSPGRWPYSKCSKIVEVGWGCSCWELKPYHRDSLWRNSKGKRHRFVSVCQRIWLVMFRNLFIFGLLRLQIKARQEIPEFLTANLYRYTFIRWG